MEVFSDPQIIFISSSSKCNNFRDRTPIFTGSLSVNIVINDMNLKVQNMLSVVHHYIFFPFTKSLFIDSIFDKKDSADSVLRYMYPPKNFIQGYRIISLFTTLTLWKFRNNHNY